MKKEMTIMTHECKACGQRSGFQCPRDVSPDFEVICPGCDKKFKVSEGIDVTKGLINIAPNKAKYRYGSTEEKKAIALGWPLEFEAISIGFGDNFQLCIMPLDQGLDQKKNAELLVRLWNEHHSKQENISGEQKEG